METFGAEPFPSTGDAAGSFERAVSPFLSSLAVYCRAVARNRWDADDLFQDTLEKAFRRHAQTGGVSMNKSYLMRIASNARIDRLRASREQAHPPEWAGWEAARRESEPDALWLMERLVADLTPKQRTVLILREVFGLTAEETARRLGLNAGTVKSLLRRARDRLKRTNRDDEDECGGRAADRGMPTADADLVDRYVRALRAGSVERIVQLGSDRELPQERQHAAPQSAERQPPHPQTAEPHSADRQSANPQMPHLHAADHPAVPQMSSRSAADQRPANPQMSVRRGAVQQNASPRMPGLHAADRRPAHPRAAIRKRAVRRRVRQRTIRMANRVMRYGGAFSLAG